MTTKTAKETYEDNKTEVLDMLLRLHMSLDTPTKDYINWADAGAMNETKNKMKKVCDFYFNEGE